jgi:hypothetical protein
MLRKLSLKSLGSTGPRASRDGLKVVINIDLQAIMNITASSCINFKPLSSGDTDWIEIVTAGVTGCTAKSQ